MSKSVDFASAIMRFSGNSFIRVLVLVCAVGAAPARADDSCVGMVNRELARMKLGSFTHPVGDKVFSTKDSGGVREQLKRDNITCDPSAIVFKSPQGHQSLKVYTRDNRVVAYSIFEDLQDYSVEMRWDVKITTVYLAETGCTARKVESKAYTPDVYGSILGAATPAFCSRLAEIKPLIERAKTESDDEVVFRCREQGGDITGSRRECKCATGPKTGAVIFPASGQTCYSLPKVPMMKAVDRIFEIARKTDGYLDARSAPEKRFEYVSGLCLAYDMGAARSSEGYLYGSILKLGSGVVPAR